MRHRLWFTYLRILKRWSRAGLYDYLQLGLSDLKESSVVLSIGGFGEVDKRVRTLTEKKESKFFTLDIDASHNPDILGDMHNLERILRKSEIQPTHIIALEVLEHVHSPDRAIKECARSLSPHGKLILSVPWIIPIHDRPHDYWRMTPQAIRLMSQSFINCEIMARGNEFDSVLCLILRGLFSRSRLSKLLTIVVAPLTLLIRRPRLIADLEAINSTIGYVATCTNYPIHIMKP